MAVSVQDLTRDSGFVFEGTVRRVGAAAHPGGNAAPDMAVVHVTRILKGPHVLAGFSGQEITIQLHEHETVRPGLQAVFFTNGLQYGDSLTVREVGRVDAGAERVETLVRDATQNLQDDRLAERLAQAEVVVSGVVKRTAPYVSNAPKSPVSEHDPDWWEAVIQVKEALKGDVPAAAKGRPAEVVTLFAHSKDIVWYQSPKFEAGDDGIFLLHRTDFRGRETPALACTHPLDFHPESEIGRIRALLTRSRR